MPGTADSLLPLGYAVGIGLLVGLERGWTKRGEDDGHRVAGIRTFGLLGLAGGAAALIAGTIGVALILLCGTVLVVGYWRQTQASNGQSATSAIAGLLVLGLGALAASGSPETALAVAAVTMLLLSNRQRLHGLVKDLSADEIRAAAEFAIVALVLFPLAPDRGIGPFGAVNPHRILLVVVMISGVSFAAYLVGHHLPRGKGGALVTAVLGALVSSTAVTVALARRMRNAGGATGALATALLVASIVSGLRVIVLVAVLAPGALAVAAAAITPGLAVLAAAMMWAWNGDADPADPADPAEDRVVVGNPLELGTALTFAAVTVVATFGSRLTSTWFGASGPLVVLTATGFADVDAAILACSSMPRAEQASLAGLALAGPVAANMLLKAVVTVVASRSRAGTMVAIPLGLCGLLIAGAGALCWFDLSPV
jgi:uncharacterized membrane protein (DUF4010 family)